jgi:transcription factor SPN1
VRLKVCPDIQQQQAAALPPSLPEHLSKPRDEYESSGGESEDDYVQERTQNTKIKKRTSSGRKSAESGEKRKRKRRQPPPPIDPNDLPPEQGKSLVKAWVITNVMPLYLANKLRLDMKIDEILRSKKSNRPRKKKTNDEVLDSFADDEVARLREAMNTAADEDMRSNNDKLPATAKLRLLPEAMDTLRK